MKKVILLLFLVSLNLFAKNFQNYKQIIDKESVINYQKNRIVVYNSSIDWSRQIISVNVQNKVNINSSREIIANHRVLQSLALKRSAEILNDININSNYTIKSLAEKDKNFSQEISMFIKGLIVTERTYDKNSNTFSSTIEIPLAGNKNSLIYIFTKNKLKDLFSFSFFNIFFKQLYAANETGLIIDARNIEIDPALFPKIKTDKKTLYDPSKLKKDILIKKGAVQYLVIGKLVDEKLIKIKSLEGIESLQRTGNNPKFIKAFKSEGNIKTDVVISKKDALDLKYSEVFDEAKVSVIVDNRVAGIIGKQLGDYEIKIVRVFNYEKNFK